MFNVNLLTILFTLFTLISFTLIHKFFIKPFLLLRYYKKQGLTPIYYPMIGKLLQFSKDTQKHKDAMYSIKTWAKTNPQFIGTVSLLTDRCEITLSTPYLINEFTKQDTQNFRKFERFLTFIKHINPKSLLLKEGEEHKKMRRNYAAGFQFDILSKNIPSIIAEVNNIFASWKEHDLIGKSYIPLEKEIATFASEVVGSLLFGIDYSHYRFKGARVSDFLIDSIQKQGDSLPITMFFPLWMVDYFPFWKLGKVLAVKKDISEFASYMKDLVRKEKPELFDKNMKGPEHLSDTKSLLSVLLKLNSENKPSDNDVFGIYQTLFAAGTITMSRTLSISFYLLTKYPQYKAQLRNEARAVIKNFDNFGFEELDQLKLLDAFIKEVLRLYGPLQEIFQREAIIDTKIGNISVKKGTVVSVYLNANCWNESFYKDAESFVPERWLLKDDDRDPFGYLPFYAGPRHCVGRYLAEMEAKVLLVKALEKYDLELKEGYDLRMQHKFIYEASEMIPIKFIELDRST